MHHDVSGGAAPPSTILLVDDSTYWTETIADALRREGYVVSVLHDGLAAVERLRREPPNVLITDYFLANLDGGKLCQIAKHIARDPQITTIILTGGADRKLSRGPSSFADAVIAKNAPDIVFGDLRRALDELRDRTPIPADAREVIGHERLAPRAIAGKLHGLKQYLDALHEGIGDAVLGIDPSLRVYFVNSVAVELFNLREEDAIARPVHEILGVAPEHSVVELIRSAIQSVKKPGRPHTLEVGKSTLRVTCAGLLSPDGRASGLLIARDITDLKEAERARLAIDARLHEADKMASLGQMVTGVSHEINSPLAAVLLNIADLKQQLSTFTGTRAISSTASGGVTLDELIQIVRETEEAADRIRSVVAEMRVFAHPSGGTGERARIEELIELAFALVANETRYKAKLVRVYNQTPELVVDRTRLSQAFLNVALNAAQAIKGNNPDENWIRVETRATADGIVVEISNNGTPIPDDVLPRMFDPFFTTKQAGEGLGLGLSIAYETLRRHGGYIEASSRPGEPTLFRFHLPFDTGVALSAGSEEEPVTTRNPARVLLVDDDKLFRNSLRRVLERLHDVEVAADAERAIAFIEERPFDVVICDLIMPKMTGMRLFEIIQERFPEQARRFVFLTGGTSSQDARDFLQRVDNPRAYKPIGADDIDRLVARCLSQFAEAKPPER